MDLQEARTPLHKAVCGGHIDIVRLLVENGAEVNARDGNDETPLHKAAERGYIEVVRLLVENGAERRCP